MDDFIFPLEIRIYFDTQLQFVQLTTDSRKRSEKMRKKK